MSLVSFWIFDLVDMSTYLSPMLTIMPPRMEGSDCEETGRLLANTYEHETSPYKTMISCFTSFHFLDIFGGGEREIKIVD